jgi:hypothetical protein
MCSLKGVQMYCEYPIMQSLCRKKFFYSLQFYYKTYKPDNMSYF